MIPVMGILYGPRDAVSVLMGHGHRVSLRPSWQRPGTPDWDLLYLLDGQPVTLAELEDAAEIHEKLRGRYTTRRARLRLRTCSGLRSSPLWGVVKVVSQRFRGVVNRGFCDLLRRVLTLTLRGG